MESHLAALSSGQCARRGGGCPSLCPKLNKATDVVARPFLLAILAAHLPVLSRSAGCRVRGKTKRQRRGTFASSSGDCQGIATLLPNRSQARQARQRWRRRFGDTEKWALSGVVAACSQTPRCLEGREQLESGIEQVICAWPCVEYITSQSS